MPSGVPSRGPHLRHPNHELALAMAETGQEQSIDAANQITRSSLQLCHPDLRAHFVCSIRSLTEKAGAQKTSDNDAGQCVNLPWTPCLFGVPDLRALRAHWKMFPLSSS